jgi:hypothetical protein|nr:hypothetical protein [uncultured Prevotella sp.]DAO84719.1 MAG TPA: hypothetical protein [Caudoviricetes sp.]
MGRILSYIVKNKKFAATTENSSANAWNLNFGDGNLNNWNDKVQNKGHVRPVSALDKEDTHIMT